MTYKNELFSASSGPLASFLLAAVCLALGRIFPHEGLTLTAGISFVYGVFNCLPVVPFDGGRILRSILMMKLNVDRAEDVLKITDAAGFALLCFGACLILIVSGYNFLPLLLLSGLLLSRIRK